MAILLHLVPINGQTLPQDKIDGLAVVTTHLNLKGRHKKLMLEKLFIKNYVGLCEWSRRVLDIQKKKEDVLLTNMFSCSYIHFNYKSNQWK